MRSLRHKGGTRLTAMARRGGHRLRSCLGCHVEAPLMPPGARWWGAPARCSWRSVSQPGTESPIGHLAACWVDSSSLLSREQA